MSPPLAAQETVGRDVMPSGRPAMRPFALAMTTLSLVGLTSALVLLGTALSGNDVQWVGAPALVLVALALFAGCLALRRWHLDAAARHTLAARLSNFHAVMSQTNRLVLRRPNPGELFEGVCELCIDAGQMDLVIVDMFDEGEIHRATAKVTGVGRAPPSPGLLLDGARLQALMMTLAQHSGNCIVVHDASIDDRLSEARPWCSANGLRSLAAIPLRRGEVLIG
ncbi:MAG: GAF domain-containing protein, partial [Solirubrobacteraceae bacterium]|nr:GAF domain-containing protein [Solirubrobacteraceae bacterium]